MLHDASSESSSNDRTLDHEANSLARSLIASAKIEPRLYPKEEEENLSRWKIANRKHGDTTSGKNIGVASLRNPGTASWQMVRKPSSCKCIPRVCQRPVHSTRSPHTVRLILVRILVYLAPRLATSSTVQTYYVHCEALVLCKYLLAVLFNACTASIQIRET